MRKEGEVEQALGERAKNIYRVLGTQQGEEAIREALCEAAQKGRELTAAREVDRENLNTPMTI